MPPALTWLVRHGQSAANAGLPSVLHADVPLTELGHRQAEAVAERVARPPDLVVVSPFARARATAAPILARWPATPTETWPIGELTYLSPARCVGTTPEIRRPWIAEYWQRCDPDHLDGDDAETFRAFVARLADFHRRLAALDLDFVIAVGHGQFFRAYTVALAAGAEAAARWMQDYRARETAQPMANGEIIELSRGGTPADLS